MNFTRLLFINSCHLISATRIKNELFRIIVFICIKKKENNKSGCKILKIWLNCEIHRTILLNDENSNYRIIRLNFIFGRIGYKSIMTVCIFEERWIILGSFVMYSFLLKLLYCDWKFVEDDITLFALLFAECNGIHWIDFPIQLLNAMFEFPIRLWIIFDFPIGSYIRLITSMLINCFSKLTRFFFSLLVSIFDIC